MIYPLTNVIAEKLESQGLKYAVREGGKDENVFSYVEAGISGKKCTFFIRFFCENERNIKIITNEFAKYPMDMLDEAYQMINSINSKYRYVKFCIDPNDGAVTMQYDLPVILDDKSVADSCFELLIRFVQILDEVFPEVMKSIYGQEIPPQAE